MPPEPVYRWNHPCPPTRHDRRRHATEPTSRPARRWVQQVLTLRTRKEPTTTVAS